MSRNFFFRRIRDFGTGRLPPHSELKNRRYLIMGPIGQGGMGAVYLARDTHRGNCQIAIKEMSQSRLLDSRALYRARQSFQQEAAMLKQLSHPNLPVAYDSFEENNRSYLVMEYIEGQTLAALLKQRGNDQLAVASVIAYGLQLSSVLAYLHAQATPIIYLDLKPPNIMVRKQDQRLFLIDFGIARFFHAGLTVPPDEVFFTPGYAPPEQMVGKPEPCSDLFALGATLHQCLTGQRPQSHTREHMFDFPPVQLLNAKAPSRLCMLVEQMVNVEQQKRPCSAREVEQVLQQASKEVHPSLVLAGLGNVDANSLTVQAGVSMPLASPVLPASNWERVLQLFPQLPQHLRNASIARLKFLGKGMQPLLSGGSLLWEQGKLMAQNQKIWNLRLAILLLAFLGGSFALLKTASDLAHLHLLACAFLLAIPGMIGLHLVDKGLHSPVPRAILGLMGLSLLLALLTVQAFPDVQSMLQPLLSGVVLNQLCLVGLLLMAVINLFRTESYLEGLDHLLLSILALGCVLWQYVFGQQELAQFSALPPELVQSVNTGLIWGLCILALLVLLFLRRPFGGWGRFALVLVAGVFTAFQYVFSFSEFQSWHLGGLVLISIGFLYTWGPLVSAFLAWFARNVWLTRLALCLLALVEATMLLYQGQQIRLPFIPGNPYLLSTNLLAYSTLYQLLTPLLLLVLGMALALLLLPGRQGFRWLDYVVVLLGALLSAWLDEAFWQQQSAFFVTPVTAVTMHQQDIILAELLPGYLVYVLLAAFGMTLVVLILCSFWRQTNPYAPVDAWLRRAQTFMRVIDRLFVLACVAIAFLLENTRGIFAWLFTDRWTELFNDGQDVLNLAALAVLAVLSIVLLVRLFGSRRYELGNSERLALFGSALICLLFIWQMPQVATLPLLNQHIQFTSNLFHWSSTALRWALLIELLAVPFLAFFWFGSQVFANYRVLFTTLFLLILCFLLLQLIWPIFLLLALICLLPGILLAMRIEKAA